MFIYILNFLNDGLKKKGNIYEYSDFEIVKDAWYISRLAGIKKSIDFKNVTDKIIDIFEILNKYNITDKDSIDILNKLIKNNNNSWILEYFYYGDNNINEESKLVLSSIKNNILEKRQRDIGIQENKSLKEIRNAG